MSGPGPLDICDAVIQQLRNSPCAGLFDDTWDPVTKTGTQKFFADYAGETSEPQLIVMEPGEGYTYMSPGPGHEVWYLADGQLQTWILAPGRYQARQLGKAVANALTDAPLSWPGSRLIMFRLAGAAFQPMQSTGPNVPAVFNRIMTFAYQTQESI